MNPATLIDLLERPEFRDGLLWGLISVAIVLTLARRWSPVPLLGGAIALGAIVPFYEVEDFSLLFPTGVALLLAGGYLLDHDRRFGLPVLAAGALMILFDPMFPSTAWIRLGSFVFIGLAGWSIGRVDDAMGHTGVPALMMMGMIFGIWSGVPDTEFAAVLMGIGAATIFTVWPRTQAQIGQQGAYALAAVLVVALALGGEARSGSIVGGWATLGLFAAIPIIPLRLVNKRWWVLGIHAVVVLVSARAAAVQESPVLALAIAIPTLVFAAAAVTFVGAGERR